MGSWIRVAKAWVQGGGTSVAAAQSTSLLQLSHQGTIVRQRVKCVRGSKSKLTGSVVRLKTSPRPLGVSHWVLKSPGCLIAGNCHRRNGEGNTHKHRVGHAFMRRIHTGTNSCSYPKTECNEGSRARWTTFRTHERSGGGMWVGMEAETGGVVMREGVRES